MGNTVMPGRRPTTAAASKPTPVSPPIHVATVNIRFDGAANNPVPIPESGVVNPHKLPENRYAEQPWAVRRSRLVDALLSVGELDIVGFQEVYYNQLLDLTELLGPAFEHVGVGRNDGKRAGEHSPIFYNRDRFEQVKWKTIWLSKTPTVPGSIGWDANQTRIATLLSLKDRYNGGAFVHAICTHYDHIGLKARANSSLLIRTAIHEFVTEVEAGQHDANGSPVILFGDFNSPCDEDGYKNITSKKPLDKPSFTFLDSYTNLVARGKRRPGVQSRPYGPKQTWTGFKAEGDEETSRIDFIMLGIEPPEKTKLFSVQKDSLGPQIPWDPKNHPWAFTQYAVIDNWIEEADEQEWRGRWSDHRAVRATLERL